MEQGVSGTDQSEQNLSESLPYGISITDDGELTGGGVKGEARGNLVIPEMIKGIKVTSIADHAFIGNEKLVSVALPNSVTRIGERAFSECPALQSVVFPENPDFTTIEAWSFAESGVYSLYIPDSVTRINTQAFQGCNKLEDVTGLKSIEVLEDYLFYNCTSLSLIVFKGKAPQDVAGSIFSGCNRLQEVKYTSEALNNNPGWRSVRLMAGKDVSLLKDAV